MRKLGGDGGSHLDCQARLAAAAQAGHREQPAARLHEPRDDVRTLLCPADKETGRPEGVLFDHDRCTRFTCVTSAYYTRSARAVCHLSSNVVGMWGAPPPRPRAGA